MAATVIPMPKFMAFSDAGAPLSAGLVYTYAAGTTTPLATYSDSDLTTPNANPVVLDSAGRATIYLTASSYKIVLKNSAGATVYTQDNIIAAAPYNVDLDVPITAGEALTAGQAIYLSDGTGSRTAGRWYLTDSDTAAYSTTVITGFVTTALALGEEGSVRLLGQATVPGPVSVGLTYYLSGTPGGISTSAGTFVKNMGTADSTTTLIMTVATPVTPGGSNTQVQFNDSGVLGGDSGFTFIKATDAVAIAGATTVGGTLGVTGATTLSSTLAVTGVTTLTGGLNTPLVPAQGGTGLSSYAVGDLVYASGATTLAKLADVAVGQVLVSGGVATAPAYSASPSITALTYTTNLKSTTALATPSALTATQATAFASTVSGASIMGFGTTNDVSLMNRAGTVVLGIGPNTTTVNMTGLLTVSGFGTHSFSAGGTGTNSLKVSNPTAGAGNIASIILDADIENGLIQTFSSTYTTSGVRIQNSVLVRALASGGLSLAADHASGAIRFYSGGSTLRGGFESTSGNFHIGPTASTSHALYIEKAVSNTYVQVNYNTSATTPFGLYMAYTAAAPNSTSCEFFRGDDNVGTKFAARSNGGIANYSANNVNLSDATTKYISDVSPTPERELFRRLPLVLAKYLTSDRPVELMLTAQDVERVYPDLVEWFDEGRQLKGIREYGLLMRSIKVIQELDAQLVSMEARLTAAGV